MARMKIEPGVVVLIHIPGGARRNADDFCIGVHIGIVQKWTDSQGGGWIVMQKSGGGGLFPEVCLVPLFKADKHYRDGAAAFADVEFLEAVISALGPYAKDGVEVRACLAQPIG